MYIVGIAAFGEAVSCNHRQVYSFFCLAFAHEHGLAVAQFGVFLFVNGINIVAVFHLAKVDDAVVAVDEQVYLHTVFILLLVPGFESPRMCRADDRRKTQCGLDLRQMLQANPLECQSSPSVVNGCAEARSPEVRVGV